ncbi:MAG: hypothetical protein K2H03_03370, partial [Muribaculaceae bacterium]|nr:hypothetical protein [Muribaculaceae bacterium]
MKSTVRFLFSLLLIIICATVGEASTRVYVLPLEEEIDARAWQHTRRACDEAEKTGAQLFVVRMNTYGGAVDA